MVDTTSVDLLSLIGADVRLRKAAATRGGEWAGPCPFCGGADKQGSDRFRVWPAEGRYWCRRCNRKGDAINYVRERHNLNFEAALDRLGLPSPQPRRPAARSDRASQGATTGLAGQPSALLPGSPALASPLHEPLEPPSDMWQGRAIDFCTECIDLLWTKEGARARAWLTGKRGLTEETIAHASLGLIPENRHDPPEIWGFEADEKPVWLPHGILFPWVARGHVWRVSIRRADDRTNDGISLDEIERILIQTAELGQPKIYSIWICRTGVDSSRDSTHEGVY